MTGGDFSIISLQIGTISLPENTQYCGKRIEICKIRAREQRDPLYSVRGTRDKLKLN